MARGLSDRQMNRLQYLKSSGQGDRVSSAAKGFRQSNQQAKGMLSEPPNPSGMRPRRPQQRPDMVPGAGMPQPGYGQPMRQDPAARQEIMNAAFMANVGRGDQMPPGTGRAAFDRPGYSPQPQPMPMHRPGPGPVQSGGGNIGRAAFNRPGWNPTQGAWRR